jgi:hypothetical protein
MKEQLTKKHTIKVELDASQIEELDRQVALKVAAVKQGEIIGSKVVDLSKMDDASSIPIEVEYLTKERSTPMGVQLMVGPDVPDENFLLTKPLKRSISGKYNWKEFVYDAKKWVIPRLIYPWWLVWCRSFTIQGQVVCGNGSPVPGATVTAYDVDRWWWWCWKDKVASAVTDANGNFEIKFKWCCRWWWYPLFLKKLPYLRKKWEFFLKDWFLDPVLVEKIKVLFEKEGLQHSMPALTPKPDLKTFEILMRKLESFKRLDVGNRMVVAPETLENTRQALVKLLPDAPELKALHIWPWWPWGDCNPDIIFKVTQDCGEPDTIIYEEDCGDTRWNIPTTLNVTLVANSNACCAYDDDTPEGEGFKFGNVGCTSLMYIGGNDPLSPVPAQLLGYAYPGTLDRPFGGTLRLSGVFCEDADIDYYKVQYSTDGINFNDMDETMYAGFNRIFWGLPPGAPPTADPQWNTVLFKTEEKNGQIVLKSREKYEKEHEPTSWGYTRVWTTNADVLIYWVSSRLPDDYYILRVYGYKEDFAGNLIDGEVLKTCAVEPPQDELLKIRIDNRISGDHPPSVPSHPCGPGYVHLCTVEPDCDFVRVVKNEDPVTGLGEEVGACGIMKLKATDKVTIHFNASDKDGHLEAYQLTSHYAESAVLNLLSLGTLSADSDPQYGPDYGDAVLQGASRPYWYGGNFKLELPGTAFPTCCAYLLKLRAWKRTTNGCTNPYYFFWNVCELTFTVIREDLIGSPSHPECK